MTYSQSSEFENSYALCMGVDRYNEYESLRTAVNGAQSIHRWLTSRKYKSQLLITPMQPINTIPSVTRATILDWFEYVDSVCSNNDRLLIYFAGHGTKNGYFVLDEDSPEPFIKMSLLIEKVAELRQMPRHVILIYDACYSICAIRNDFGFLSSKNQPDLRQAFEIIMATNQNQSLDHPILSRPLGVDDIPVTDLSPFSYYLLEGLNGKAADAQGRIFSLGLAQYVKQNVVSYTSNQQTPEYTPVLLHHRGGAYIFHDTPLKNIKNATEASVESTQNNVQYKPIDEKHPDIFHYLSISRKEISIIVQTVLARKSLLLELSSGYWTMDWHRLDNRIYLGTPKQPIGHITRYLRRTRRIPLLKLPKPIWCELEYQVDDNVLNLVVVSNLGMRIGQQNVHEFRPSLNNNFIFNNIFSG